MRVWVLGNPNPNKSVRLRSPGWVLWGLRTDFFGQKNHICRSKSHSSRLPLGYCQLWGGLKLPHMRGPALMSQASSWSQRAGAVGNQSGAQGCVKGRGKAGLGWGSILLSL